MRRTTKVIAAMLMLALPTQIATVDEPDFKELWRWLCSSTGFYEMTVLPDGSYQPQTDFTDCCGSRAVEISVGELSKDARVRCGHELAQPLQPYVVQIRDNARAHDFSEDPCRQMVEVQQHTGPDGSLVGVSEVKAASHMCLDCPRSMSLLIHQADTDWRFVISSTGLRTDKDAAQTNAAFANIKGALQVSPEASAWLRTGTCQLMFGR
jgi:hypothetical protein